MDSGTFYEMLCEEYGNVMKPCDVAAVLRCHPTHVRVMCKRGDLPAVQIGKRWFIPTARLAAMLESGMCEQMPEKLEPAPWQQDLLLTH